MTSKLDDLKAAGEAPHWLTSEGFQTLSQGYLLPGETPKGMWTRCANASAKQLKKPELGERFFELMWNNWLCLASPICANMGTERGLPISCYGLFIPDSIDGIWKSMHEVAMLTKHGGGIGTYWGGVRNRGASIRGNGKSDGIIPFCKVFDSTIIGTSQGGTRRGAGSGYLDIEHGDWDEFVEMRRPSGDINRQCLNIHHGACISDEFMEKVLSGDKKARKKWRTLLKTRFETGEPYMFFKDSVNRDRPECYKANNLDVKSSQLCTEILLHSDEEHTFVCCLSSMNLARYHEWKNTTAVKDAIWFLDGVMEEFIQKTEGIPGFERARNFSLKSRALGLGVLGFHTLLQQQSMPFDSLQAYLLNKTIFKNLQIQAEAATCELAKEYGEPEWCKGFNRRNTHLLSLAPTVSNSTISGYVSPGIEPWSANAFAQKSAKGTFFMKNKILEKLLEDKGENTDENWKSIINNEGSVQQLSCLTGEEKEVFLTAREINQFAVIKLAGERQKFLDQGQSLNLFFPENADPSYFNQVHIEAWKQGLKTLYYCRTSSVLRGDSGTRVYKRELGECSFCEG
jgi:ribonucleoside-diphosphate reductase alpha chain